MSPHAATQQQAQADREFNPNTNAAEPALRTLTDEGIVIVHTLAAVCPAQE